MIQVIDTDTISGRIGRGFAQGLSEQVPKEIERYRLSSGLKELGQSAEGKEPYQLFSDLLSIPGMTSEKAQMLYPYLQQQLARREDQRRVQQGVNVPQGTQQPTIAAQKSIQDSGQISQEGGKPVLPVGKGSSIVSPESTIAAQQVWNEPSYDERLQEAVQLSNENRAKYPTPQDAMTEVNERVRIKKANFDARKAGFTDQKNLQDTADTEFNKYISEKLQKSLTESYDTVWGDLQSDLRNSMYEDIKAGVSYSDAAKKYGDQAKEIAKTMTNLLEKGSVTRYFDPKQAKTTKEAIESTFRNEFKKIGKLEEYSHILESTMGLSPAFAAENAFPVKDNKKNSEILSKVKSSRPQGLGVITNAIYTPKSGKELVQITDDLMNNFGKDDSILSYGLELKRKGFDENEFYSLVRNKYNDYLNPRQLHELETASTIHPSMGDSWLYSFLPYNKGALL